MITECSNPPHVAFLVSHTWKCLQQPVDGCSFPPNIILAAIIYVNYFCVQHEKQFNK